MDVLQFYYLMFMNDEIRNDILEVINSAAGVCHEPTIIYSSKIIRRIVKKVNDELNKHSNMNCLYSVKANFNKEIISTLAPLVKGFDVASWKEYELVRDFEKAIFASGFAFTNEQIVELVNRENFDFVSLNQLKLVSDKINNQDIGIRISGTISELESMRVEESRFGFCYPDDVEILKNICEENNICLKRLHIHLGEKNEKCLNDCINEVSKWCDCFKDICQINVGGGWDYLSDVNALQNAIERLSSICRDKCIFIEPGSLLVRKAGILVSHVIDYKIKENNEGYIVVDTSAFNLSSWYTPRLIAVKGGGEKIPFKKYNIYGNTCFENDVFQINQKLSVGIGDDLFFYPVGAYYVSTCRKLHNLDFPKEILI